MKGTAKYAAGLLPLLLLTGCFPFHKKKAEQAQIHPMAPPIVAPAPMPAPPPVPEPATVALAATMATETGEASALAAAPPKSEPVRRPRYRRPVVKPAEEAATPDNGVSALGQLSSGDPGDLRLQTQNSIDSTERGLKDIHRNLSPQDQRIVEHIQEFLKQAKKALAAGDVDGASTLANKAKVLLAEVVQ